MKFRSFVLALVLAAIAPAAQAQRHWFEDGATPLRYEIAVTPNVDAATFTGDVVITIENSAPLTNVTMNALDLTVQRAIDRQCDGASRSECRGADIDADAAPAAGGGPSHNPHLV